MYLTRKEAAVYTGFSHATLAKWAATEKGPRFKKFGRGRSARVRYSIIDLRIFMESAGEEGANTSGLLLPCEPEISDRLNS